MATTKIKQLESFDSGSNYNFQDKMLNKSIARSMFDLSHRRIGTMCENGVIMPVGIIPTIPNDSYEIDADILLRALPTVVPLESRQRLYMYAFYNRMGDLWNNFETFMKKGYTGNVVKKIPVLTTGKNTLEISSTNTLMKARGNLSRNTTWEVEGAIQATSMGESLGLPHGYNYTSKTVSGETIYGYENTANQNKFIATTREGAYTEEISALPFMMLLRIWRDYFTNKNYWIDDRVILPDDDQEFRLNDDGELISAKNESKMICFDIHSKVRDIKKGSVSAYSDDGTIYYMGLPYHEYPKDYFTSALPFMQRGDAAKIEREISLVNDGGKLQIFNSDGTLKGDSNKIGTSLGAGITGILTGATGAAGKISFFDGSTPVISFAADDYLGVGPLATNKYTLEIFMNDLRKLAIEQSELEAMARTDGSYAEFGLTFFNKVSKNALDHKPVYIGGLYKEIRYTEVVQTSESGNTPMGSYTGHSTSSMNGNIGRIDCDDYGYIMILACIMPDVIYSENLERHWTNLLQSQMYLPPRSKLGMTNIYKKEVRFNYTESQAAQTENNNLFAYQNIFDEMRYKPNEIHGEIANMWNKSFSPYTQSRIIADTPVWGREFAMADSNNMRNEYLVAPEETPFTYDLGLHIRAVRPIPYRPIPANLTGL